jgi:hypothetical protein
MSFTRCTLIAALALCLPVRTLHAQSAAAPAADAPPPSHAALPQIVRLSLVEGDVRIALGKQGAKLTGNAWEHATADIPLASGYSLATGPDGRAEIEFEDASTIYIAPNSALAFGDLTTKDNVPQSSIALLSGTVILHLRPRVPGERYLLQTATYTMAISYGEKNYSRVTSYLDGMHMTPLEGTQVSFNGKPLAVPDGATYIFYGQTMFPKNIAPTPALAAFDAWVAARVRSRDTAIAAVMHEAGLNTPIPGLADLAGQGTFTPCAPYGTCWEPTHGWAQHADASTDTAHRIQPVAEAQSPVPQAQTVTRSTAVSAGAAPVGFPYDDLDDFPCDPYRLWYLRSQWLLNPVAYYSAAYPYDWAVCHAGFWINRDHHYRWVAGTRKHHHCPVRWVKYHGKLGYVPLHPRDERGRAPVNLRHGLYTLTGRPDRPVERTAFDGRTQPKLLDATPKDFRRPAPPVLARADSPEVAVHMMHEPPASMAGGRSPARAVPVSTLQFNDHSQRFVLATHVTDAAGHTHTFTQSLSDHGGGHMAAHGYSGGARSGGGFSGSHSGGASHSGGGFSGGGHSGGSSSGGGGHSGGGSSGGTSSSAGASSAGATAGGGGRH